MTDNRRFAYDSYRRLLAMFGNVVYEIPEGVFDQVLEDVKTTHNYQSDLDLTVSDLKEIVDQFKDYMLAKQAKSFLKTLRNNY